MTAKIRIGLFYNLKSEYPLREHHPFDINAEWDSLDTFVEIQKAMENLGYSVTHIGDPSKLLNEKIRKNIDIAFNMCEMTGYRFREAIAPSIFELCSIPYTFSSPDTMVVCLDKNLSNFVVRQAGGLVPDWKLTDQINLPLREFHSYPYIVKPSAEGSGMGINRASIVNTEQELLEQVKLIEINYRQPAIVQKFLSGREFTIGVLEMKDGTLLSLEPLEIRGLTIDNGLTYNYVAKSHFDRYCGLVPLSSNELSLKNKIQNLANLAFRSLRCRDAARIDIRLDSNENPNFLEINTLPHFHPLEGDFCRSALHAGISYVQLIDVIIQNTMQRFGFDLQSV